MVGLLYKHGAKYTLAIHIECELCKELFLHLNVGSS